MSRATTRVTEIQEGDSTALPSPGNVPPKASYADLHLSSQPAVTARRIGHLLNALCLFLGDTLAFATAVAVSGMLALLIDSYVFEARYLAFQGPIWPSNSLSLGASRLACFVGSPVPVTTRNAACFAPIWVGY